MLDAFYTYFRGAHPFVLPKKFLLRVSHEEAVEPLMAAMRWAGSLFIDVASARKSLLQEALHRLRSVGQDKRDGFTLQTMMVLVVALGGMAQDDQAREMLADAEKLSCDIAINTKVFASYRGRGSYVLEESWRRPWWDLFVIDGMIAGKNFALFDVSADVDLPCEEVDFLSGNIPTPRSLVGLEDQDHSFGPEPAPLSSFAYRILGVRNFGNLMRTPTINDPSDSDMARIQALLENWSVHLPESKRHTVDSQGRVDEMLFQAHMHTLTAATAISNLVSLPIRSLTIHIHFFTCVLTPYSTVHLGYWAFEFVQYDDDDLSQLLRLNLGALNELISLLLTFKMSLKSSWILRNEGSS